MEAIVHEHLISADGEMNWIGATRPPISDRDHHIRRPDIGMDDIRNSFSRLKKDLKRRVGGKKRALDSVRADVAGESVGPSASPLRPDYRVTASGHGEVGGRISTGVSQARSRDPSPMPADEGRPDDSQRKEVDAGEKDPDDAGIAAGNEPSQDVKQIPSPLLVTSIPCNQEPDSM